MPIDIHVTYIHVCMYRARKIGCPASPIKKPALAATPTKQPKETNHIKGNYDVAIQCFDDIELEVSDSDDDAIELLPTETATASNINQRNPNSKTLQQHLSSRGKRQLLVSPPQHHLDDEDVSFDAEFGLDELLTTKNNYQKSQKKSNSPLFPSYLGHTESSKAKRVLLSSHTLEHEDSNTDSEVDFLPSSRTQERSQKYRYFNEPTGAAADVEAGNDNDHDDADTMSVFTLNTTLSLDDGCSNAANSNTSPSPRLVFSKRSKDIFDPADIKEIVLNGMHVHLYVYNCYVNTLSTT